MARRSNNNEGGAVVGRLPLNRAKELGLLDSGRRDWGWLNQIIREIGEDFVQLKPPKDVGMATFRMRVLSSGRRLLREGGWRLRTQTKGGKLQVWKEKLER